MNGIALIILSACLLHAAAASRAGPSLCDVKSFGAAGDGMHDDLPAFDAAFQACSADGTVLASAPGTYKLSGSLVLNVSRVHLHVAGGAHVVFDATHSLYPFIPPLPSYGEGRDTHVKYTDRRYQALIFGSNLTSVHLSGDGPSSVIDGSGTSWWEAWFASTLIASRPHLLELMYSSNILIEDLAFQDR